MREPGHHDGANIVLTGFMGTGKTTVGRLLAGRLGCEFVDTDQLIEERHGPIPEIFRKDGEEHFRRIEREVAAEMAARRGLIVATGGRMLLDEANAAALRSTGRVICLVAEPDEIVRRVLGDGVEGRPLLDTEDPEGRVRALLAERAARYAVFDQVATDGRSPDEVADAVLAVVRG